LLSRWWKEQAPRNLIGLDLNAESIKLMLLDTTTAPYTIKYFAQAQLPVGALVKDEIKKPDQIIPILKSLLQLLPAKQYWAAFAIPRASAIIKNISVDSRLTESEKEARAWVEANRFYPDLVGEIYLDFNVLGINAANPNLLEMILVACRKDQVKPYIELIQQAGMIPKLIDVNCYALERSIKALAKKDTVEGAIALLNFNGSISSLIVIHQDELIYAHDHSFDGQRLVNLVRKQLNMAETEWNFNHVSFNPAEELAYSTVLKDILSAHLRHTFHFFYSSRPQIIIKKLFVAGDLATIPLIAKTIQNEVTIETQIFNPLDSLQIDKMLDPTLLQQNPAASTLCLGLALSQLKG
jgi:type IV pilus assembly protein PilM